MLSLVPVSARCLHVNHQGSIIAHSNSSGNVINTLAYDAYGIPASMNVDTFAYTGQIYLKALNLYYYKARIYSPKIGRFLQTDPIGYKDQMNLYAYVGNDPINRIDPTGLQAADPSLTCAARFYCEQSTNNTWTVRVHTPRGELIKIEERGATDEYGKPPVDCSRTPGVCVETVRQETEIIRPRSDTQDQQSPTDSSDGLEKLRINDSSGRASKDVKPSEPEIQIPEIDVPEPPEIAFKLRL